MIDNKFVVRISERQYAPRDGEAVSDVFWKRNNYPNHQELEEFLALHFSDWYVQVVPI